MIDRDASRDVAGLVIDLRADPEPRERLRTEQRQAEQQLNGEQPVGEEGVPAAAALRRGIDIRIAHRRRAGAPADE